MNLEDILIVGSNVDAAEPAICAIDIVELVDKN
jgi:hypothetical protein